VAPTSGVEAAVDEYVRDVRESMKDEFEGFLLLPTDEGAVTRAALAQLEDGKRHPHQYRITRAALRKSCKLLLASLPELRAAATFDDLFKLVHDLIRPISGIGELAVYDTAIRVGARFGREPEKVYVHAGTRDGVRALGLDGRRPTIEMHELPEPISRRLSGREAEDLLCRYKSSLVATT
jgi:hypothetical protein